jgi:hypothetical protein
MICLRFLKRDKIGIEIAHNRDNSIFALFPIKVAPQVEGHDF